MSDGEALRAISELYYVDVVETETGKVEKRMGPHSARRASRLKREQENSLNERYHVELTPKFEEDEKE